MATPLSSDQAFELEAPIIAIGGVVYQRNESGQVELLLIKKRGGFWTLPKGRLKPGESEPDAVVREIAEETGISGSIESVVQQVRYNIHKGGRQRLKQVTYYLVQAREGWLRPDPREKIKHVHWFPIDVALQHIRRGRIRVIVRAAQTLLAPLEATKESQP